MKLILVRHGETDWNKLGKCQGISDVPLNSTGEEQARNLGNSLKNEDITAIFSSDMKRAINTAEFISRHHDLKVQTDKRFREMDQGDFEGLDFEYIRKHYSHVLKKWREEPETTRIPGGESLTEVQSRAWGALGSLLSQYKGKNILLVTHNLTIVTLLCRFLGKPLSSFMEFEIHETSKTIINCNNNKFKVELLSDTSHIT